jgi:hypothetical protein
MRLDDLERVVGPHMKRELNEALLRDIPLARELSRRTAARSHRTRSLVTAGTLVFLAALGGIALLRDRARELSASVSANRPTPDVGSSVAPPSKPTARCGGLDTSALASVKGIQIATLKEVPSIDGSGPLCSVESSTPAGTLIMKLLDGSQALEALSQARAGSRISTEVPIGVEAYSDNHSRITVLLSDDAVVFVASQQCCTPGGDKLLIDLATALVAKN